MNFMGNPRRLASHPRTSGEEYLRRQRLATPTPSERPQLSICQSFQSQSTYSQNVAGSAVTSTSSTHDGNTFEVKRRRLLQQKDWLGLDLSAPIKIYDIRAAKERKRRANGPFMKPVFSPVTELSRKLPTTSVPSPQLPLSPSTTSHSSRSLRPEPSVSSVQSSEPRGSGFVPSRHTSPALAQRGSSISDSVSISNLTWNPISVEPGIPFVPDKNDEIDFFRSPNANDVDMKNVWNLVEERKLEDKLLCAEFGWGSESLAEDSQMSLQQRGHSRDVWNNIEIQQSNHSLPMSSSQLYTETKMEEQQPCKVAASDGRDTLYTGKEPTLQDEGTGTAQAADRDGLKEPRSETPRQHKYADEEDELDNDTDEIPWF